MAKAKSKRRFTAKKKDARPKRRSRRTQAEVAEFVRGGQLMLAADIARDEPAEFTEVNDLKKRLWLAGFAATGRYDYAAKAAGVTPVTGWHWRHADDAAFNAAFERAYVLSIERWESEMARRGFQGVEKPVYQGGRMVGTVREYDTTAGIFMLKGALPHKYRDNVAIEQRTTSQVNVDVTLSLRGVPQEEVERRLDAARQVLAAKRLPDVDATATVVEETSDTPAKQYAAELAKRNGGGNGSNGHG